MLKARYKVNLEELHNMDSYISLQVFYNLNTIMADIQLI